MLVYLQMLSEPADRTLFEQLYYKYRGLMLYVTKSILHNQQDAEDAVHQAFVSLAENISKLHGVEEPQTRAYLVMTAESKAIDLYRKNVRRPSALYNEETVGIVVETETGDLADAILRLPAKDRTVLLLRYDSGYSDREVAQLLGLSLSAVRKRLQRAKERLRKLLEEDVS